MSRRFKLKFNDAPSDSSPAVPVTFGSLTRANAGGYPAPSGASAISGGTATGYTLSGGYVVATSNGSAASGTMTFTGSSVTWNITAVAGEYSVRTSVELEAALAAAETAGTSGTYVIKLRSGTYSATSAPDIRVYGITMAGTLVDANNGAIESAYNRNATASFTGGSITIDAYTAYGPVMDARFRIIGSTGIIVQNLTFAYVPTTDAYNRDDGGPGTSVSSVSSFYQALVEQNGTHTAEPLVIFKSNRFGGYNINGNPNRWGQGIRFANAKQAILEDNDFNGVYIGAIFAAVERGVARRNAIQNMLVDGIRFMGNNTASTAYTSQRCEATDNTIWNVTDVEDWAGAHPDGIQIGTSADDVPYNILLKWNYLHLDVAPTSHPTYPDNRRVTQGIYMDDVISGITIDGVVANNFICVTTGNAINVWRGTLEVRNNNVIKDTIHQEPSPDNTTPVTNIRLSNGTAHVINNNVGTIANTGGVAFTESGNFAISADTTSGTASSYYDTFDGPFTVGAYGPSWTIDETSASTVRASIDSIFNDKTGGGAAGIGFKHS